MQKIEINSLYLYRESHIIEAKKAQGFSSIIGVNSLLLQLGSPIH